MEDPGGEIGVRLACGATPANVRRLVLRHGMLLASTGAPIGGAAVIAAGRLLESLLFQTTPSDPRSLAAGTILVLAATLFACWIPAARAATLDFARVLRAEIAQCPLAACFLHLGCGVCPLH